MAIKLLPLFSCILFLSLFLSSLAPAQSSPFGFIQNLEGSHKGSHLEGVEQLKKYLEKFGYLQYGSKSTHANDNEFDSTLATAIKAYQKFFKLKETGTVDAETVSTMMKPRCGVPDIVNRTTYMGNHENHLGLRIVSRYNIPGYKWPASKYALTYKFITAVPSNHANAIRTAYTKWNRVYPKISFREVASNAASDCVIGFYKGAHGDNSAFDGPYGVLAHAYYPTDGRLHFDGAENWAVGAIPNTFDVETVAAHEIGHQLGLGHSQVRAALMWPSAEIGKTKPINIDDIQGLRALYGP